MFTLVRPNLNAGSAYAPATVADALGVEPATLDDWLSRGALDLPVLILPDGSRRIPDSAVLHYMRARNTSVDALPSLGTWGDGHPLAPTAGLIAPNRFYTPSATAMVLGMSDKGLQEWRRDGRGPKVTHLGKLPRYRRRHILDVLNHAS